MISTAYIQAYAPHDQFLYESHFYVLDVEDAEQALLSLETKIEEKKFFGESTNEDLLYLEAERQNIFTSIGEAIINLFKTFFNGIKSIGTSIKECFDGSRKKLNDEKKLEAMRSNPELAQQFLKSVLNGDIKARDVKDLNKMIEEATEITKKLTKNQYDKKTFSQKMGELGENAEKALRPITAVAGIAAAVLGVVVSVNQLRDRRSNAEERNLRNEQTRLNIRRTLNELEENPYPESVLDDEVGDYISESASPVDAIKKLLDFFAERVNFCNDATKKMKGLQSILQSKLKSCKTAEEASVIKEAMGGIRKIMAVITEEMTTAKNVSGKFYKKLGGGDK